MLHQGSTVGVCYWCRGLKQEV